MPRFADFLDLNRNEHDRGFYVGDALGIDPSGRVVLRTDPSGPFYVNARGELALRLGEGLIAEPGSPVRLMAVGAKATRLAVAALQTNAETADAELTALEATVATNTTNIATNTSDIALFSGDLASKVDTSDFTTHEADTTTHGISAFGATVVDDADAATARTTLGLGTIATLAATARPFSLALIGGGGTAVTLTNLTNAASLLPATGVTIYVKRVDLTGFTRCRLIVHRNSGTCGAGSTITLKYAASLSTSEASYSDIGTSAVSVLIDDTVGARPYVQTSSWIALAAGAIGDVFVTPIGSGGDGASDPTIGYVEAQFG